MKTISIILGLLICSGPALAVEPEATGAPPELRAWTDWVLHGREEALCPPDHDRQPRCAWPVSLALDLTAQGGCFTAVFD